MDTDCTIETLFNFCTEAFHSAVSKARSAASEWSEHRAEWEEQQGRFLLWGGCVAASSELEGRLRNAQEDELLESVLIVLCTMAHDLRSGQFFLALLINVFLKFENPRRDSIWEKGMFSAPDTSGPTSFAPDIQLYL
jgi:hypothetical protein